MHRLKTVMVSTLGWLSSAGGDIGGWIGRSLERDEDDEWFTGVSGAEDDKKGTRMRMEFFTESFRKCIVTLINYIS